MPSRVEAARAVAPWTLLPCYPLPFGDPKAPNHKPFVFDVTRSLSSGDGAEGLLSVPVPASAARAVQMRLTGEIPSSSSGAVRIKASLHRLRVTSNNTRKIADLNVVIPAGTPFDETVVVKPARLQPDDVLTLYVSADGQSRLYSCGVAFT